MTRRIPPVIGVLSARPDGATSLACALAARLSAGQRVLLVDLCRERPEVGALLDMAGAAGLNELAYQARLAPVDRTELEAAVRWQDGLGVLPASWPEPERQDDVTAEFVDGLLSAASAGFDHVVADLGRPRPVLPATGEILLWVVAPGPLGMAALDQAARRLTRDGWPWRDRARAVLNRTSPRSWSGTDRFIRREYGIQVVGHLPAAFDFWQRAELSHSLRALSVPLTSAGAFRRAYGGEALAMRRAVEALVEHLASETFGREAVEA